MSWQVSLPDCTSRAKAALLSQRQRRELVRVLATEGAEGLEAWIEQEMANDPHIRARIERERARLERQAEREKRRLEAEREQGRSRIRGAFDDELESMAERERALREELEELKHRHRASPQELAERSDLFRAAVETEPETPGLLTRAKNALYRFWLWLIELWIRLLRWLRDEKPPQEQAVIELPEGLTLDLPDLMATRPGLRVEIRRRVRREEGWRGTMRRWWRRLTGREDYSKIARKIMAEELSQTRDVVRAHLEDQQATVEQQLAHVEDELTQTRRERNEQLRDLENRYDAELEELEERIEDEPLDEVREEVLEELRLAGLVAGEGRPTENLLSRFAELLYEDVRRALPAAGNVQPGAFMGGEGEYEKHPLRSLNERGSMDIAASVVQARQNHPSVRHIYDSDLLVRREIKASSTHVVLVLDRSGSMEEGGRFEAAKRVALVMYRAVKDHDPRHRVDILTMSTGVERVDLEGCWNAELGGFTNFEAAFRMAHDLFEVEGADRRLLYLVTDGLPEAHIGEDGEPVVDQPEVCMPPALEAAKQLGKLEHTRMLIIQLETRDELFVDAARELAEAAGGRIQALDPDDLTEQVLLDFEEQTGLN